MLNSKFTTFKVIRYKKQTQKSLRNLLLVKEFGMADLIVSLSDGINNVTYCNFDTKVV